MFTASAIYSPLVFRAGENLAVEDMSLKVIDKVAVVALDEDGVVE